MPAWLPEVLIGWALGIGSAILLEEVKAWRDNRALKRAIGLELMELRHRLVIIVYTVGDKTGAVDRALLEWMLPMLKRYSGVNPRDGMLSGVEGLLGRKDSELAALAKATAVGPETATNIPTVETPLLSAGAVNLQDPDLKARCLDVMAQVRMLNEMIRETQFYNHLTFTPGITDENHTRAIRNERGIFKELGGRARITADKITAIEGRHGLR